MALFNTTTEIKREMSEGEVQALLKEPIQTFGEGKYQVGQYSGYSSLMANYVYFQDGKVVQVSYTTYPSKDITLQDYVGKYGNPDESVREFANPAADSLTHIRHIWAKQGVAVVTTGETVDALVVRVFSFEPQSLEAYVASVGESVQNHQSVAINPQPSVYPSFQISPITIGLGLALVLSAIGIVFWLRKPDKN